MSKSFVSRLVLALAAGFIAVHSIGCNTTEGAGKDIENAGEGLQKAADKNK